MAAFMAIVVDLSESVKSAVWHASGRSVTLAIIAADCFSLYGAVVVARKRPSALSPRLARHSSVVAAAMVTASSS